MSVHDEAVHKYRYIDDHDILNLAVIDCQRCAKKIEK